MQIKLKPNKVLRTEVEPITYSFDSVRNELILEANQKYIVKYISNDRVITEEVTITNEI